jgi:hypothetical protein
VPVIGQLTINLEAQTAEFTSNMEKADQTVQEFGKSAAAAGQQIDFSMREARGGIALAGEELGVHLPRHLQTLIAQIPAVGAAFAEMLPIIGVIAAVAIIEKLIAKNEEAKEKLAQGWNNYGATVENVFNGIEIKMLDAGIKADELAGNHIGALEKQLRKIDLMSMAELEATFGKLAKASDTVLEQLKSHWYEIRMGSQGAQNALDQFKGKYDVLVAAGTAASLKEANDLLVGTLKSATTELDSYNQKGIMGLQVSEKKLGAQKLLVQTLQAQVDAAQQLQAVETQDKTNIHTEDTQKDQKTAADITKTWVAYFAAKQRMYDEDAAAVQRELTREVDLQDEATGAVMTSLRAAAAERVKIDAQMGAEGMKNTEAMAKLAEAADEQSIKHRLAMRQSTEAQATAAELSAVDARLAIDTQAIDKELASLEAGGEKELAKVKELEDKRTQIIQAAANQQIKIREAAEQKQYQDMMRVENEIASGIATTLAKGILESKNMGVAFKKMGAQMIESALETSIKMALLNQEGQLSDAKKAATAEYASAIKAFPAPYNVAIAAALSAAAFAGAMKFEGGGEVDSIPAMLTPGETVVSKSLTDSVKASTGGGGGKPAVHVHLHASAMDAAGMQRVLEAHAPLIAAHVGNELRKHHKG